MVVNFYLKEVAGEKSGDHKEDEITISLIRTGNNRSQSVNTKNLDGLTAVEQQTIRALVAIVEKYRAQSEGGLDMKYSL